MKTDNKKKVSVCMATFNGKDFILEQIDSILKQLSNQDELVISDDGSTDGTIELIKSFGDSRISLLHHHKKNKKKFHSHYLVSSNFENAISHASGDYIFLSDQDDVWNENKIKFTVTELENFNLVMSNYSIINRDSFILRTKAIDINQISSNILNNIIFPKFHGCCIAFDKSLLKFILPFPKNLILHDTWIGLIGLKYGKINFLKEDLVLYRRHETNSSQISGQSKNSFLFKVFYRIVLLCQFSNRIIMISINNK